MATITAKKEHHSRCANPEFAQFDADRPSSYFAFENWIIVSGYLKRFEENDHALQRYVVSMVQRTRAEIAAPLAFAAAGMAGLAAASTGVIPVPVAMIIGFGLMFTFCIAVLTGGRWPPT